MATYDLVIRDGTVADGSGSALTEADVAIVDGCIVGVGRNIGAGREEINARGFLVTPGFVDIHTHLDGHVTWESRHSPSSEHGITTIVTGSCGLGFAPCRQQDREDLISIMAGVEDIPERVIKAGLAWSWESFPQYLDAIEARPHDVDIASMIPHSALRLYVMGERATASTEATEADIARMSDAVRDAIKAGAIGFATSRALRHKSSRGETLPTVRTTEGELLGILRAMAETGRGVFQMLSDFGLFKDIAGEFAMLRRLVAETRRPLSFTVNQKHSDPDGWRTLMDLIGSASDEGLPIRAQVLGRPTGLLMGHELSRSPFDGCPSYELLSKLPLEARVAELRKPELRAKILEEFPDGGRRPNWNFCFEMRDPPNYEPPPDESFAALAERKGSTPAALAYDWMLERGGRGIIFEPAQNYADGSLNAPYEMMQHKDSLLGLGDAGAHSGVICDASYPTTMLAYWTRDRVRGPRLKVPQVIEALTSRNANAFGMMDRGRIALGYKADINVIDYDRLLLHVPQAVYDLPDHGRRLVQRADGYVATLLNGVVTFREGQPTGALPGKLVRGPQPAPRATAVSQANRG
ncbi:MAG: N-acyl-D-amino-acid deacylase family protein [Myxococcaceae bacterium]